MGGSVGKTNDVSTQVRQRFRKLRSLEDENENGQAAHCSSLGLRIKAALSCFDA